MLNADPLISNLLRYDAAIGNLTACCEGMQRMRIPASKASSPLQDAKQLASGWLTPDRVAYRAALFADLSHTALLFRASRKPDIKSLLLAVTNSVQSMNDHVADLKKFGSQLVGVQARLKATVGQLQAKRNDLGSQAARYNEEIASLQQEIARDRNAIVEAMSNRRETIVRTVFGIVLAPVTAGLSITIAGLGLVSLAEAEGQIGALKSQVSDSEQRMISLRDGLDDDDATLASLGMVLIPGGIAIGDLGSASQSLGDVATSWASLEQELRHLASSSATTSSVTQGDWYDMACREMQEIAIAVAGMR